MRWLLVLVLWLLAPAAWALPAGTVVERDLAYGADPAQRMDVYRPAGLAKNAPVILMVHGGAWAFGDKAHRNVVANKADHWLPQGFIFISVNNRLLPDADPLEQADDVARALAFAQRQAPGWGGDPRGFILMGHSAGAHLVALLSADPALATRQGALPWRGTVVLDSAAFDVEKIMSMRHPGLYDRAFGKDPAFWRAASPALRLSRPVPMLLVCSSPRALSCAQARGFAAKATATGGTASVLPVDMSHAEINRELGLDGDYTRAVDAFIRSPGR